MKKLLIAATLLAMCSAEGAAFVYEGEPYADTKSSARSSDPYVHPSNVVSVAKREAASALASATSDILSQADANATTITGTAISNEKLNVAVEPESLPSVGATATRPSLRADPSSTPVTPSLWPTGYTYKDYVDFIWKASVNELEKKETALYEKIGPFSNIHTNISGVKKGNIEIGEGAHAATDAYGLPLGIVAINPYGTYPSYAYGSFNTVIGIDSMVGYGDDGVGGVLSSGVIKPNEARYATSVGVSNKAQYMHSYAFGSQLNSLAPNSTTLGYGLTALHNRSVVIGHGVRPVPDFYFDREISESDASSQSTISANAAGVVIDFEAWCRTPSTTAANADKRVVDNIISIRVVYTPSGGTKKKLTETLVGITAVLDSPDSNGRYVQYELDPPDWKRGRYNADYGISHGDGTVNFVVPSFLDNPLCGVYVNDRNLADLTGAHLGETRVVTNFVNGAAVVKTQLDYSVSIGENAQANGSSGTHMQNVAIGRDADAPGQAAVAFGPNSFAYGKFGIALGWRANAVGDNSIAIGAAKQSGQNYFLPDTMNGTVNPNSDLALASGENAISIGFNAKATDKNTGAIGYQAKADATGAFQIGTGTNSTPNSLQFQGVTIVKEGRLVGGSADPKEVSVPQASISGEVELSLESGSMVTILPEATLSPGTEMYVKTPVSGPRNYEVYLPNEPEICAGLPCGVGFELPVETKGAFVGGKWQSHKLPARFVVKQPYSKLVVAEVTEIDDGTDWSPIITEAHVKWDGTMFTADGTKLLEGTNLHSGVSLKIKYPISGGTFVTREVAGESKHTDQGILSGTFYSYTAPFDYVPAAGEGPVPPNGGSVIPVTFIYETKCGRRPTEFTVNYETAPETAP